MEVQSSLDKPFTTRLTVKKFGHFSKPINLMSRCPFLIERSHKQILKNTLHKELPLFQINPGMFDKEFIGQFTQFFEIARKTDSEKADRDALNEYLVSWLQAMPAKLEDVTEHKRMIAQSVATLYVIMNHPEQFQSTNSVFMTFETLPTLSNSDLANKLKLNNVVILVKNNSYNLIQVIEDPMRMTVQKKEQLVNGGVGTYILYNTKLYYMNTSLDVRKLNIKTPPIPYHLFTHEIKLASSDELRQIQMVTGHTTTTLYYADRRSQTIRKIPESENNYNYNLVKDACTKAQTIDPLMQVNIAQLTGMPQSLDLQQMQQAIEKAIVRYGRFSDASKLEYKSYKRVLETLFAYAHNLCPTISLDMQGGLIKQAQFAIRPSILEEKMEANTPLTVTVEDSLYDKYSLSHFITKIGLTTAYDAILANQTATKEKIAQLKAELKQHINDPSFETLKYRCDIEIGKLKNDHNAFFKTAIYACFTGKHPLNDQCFVLIQSWLSELSSKSNDAVHEALKLANQGPRDPESLKRYQLELDGRVRNKLTLSVLNRLFLLGDMREYKKVTALDNEEDIRSLHNSFARYTHFSVIKNHYEAIKTSLDDLAVDPENRLKITKLGKQLISQNVISPKNAALQLFQKEEGILIREDQYNHLIHLTTPNAKGRLPRTVLKMGMGEGKSKVIAPLLALLKANGRNLVVQVVKDSLLDINYADACEQTLRLFNTTPYKLKFTRYALNFVMVEKGRYLSDKLENLYKDLENCVTDKRYVITSDTSLKCLKLQYEITLAADLSKATNWEKAEWKKQEEALYKIRMLLKSKVRNASIIDEVHDILDPTEKTNFTVGDPIPLTLDKICFYAEFYHFLNQIDVTALFPQRNSSTTVYDLILDNTLISEHVKPEVLRSQLMERLVVAFILQGEDTKNPLRSIFQTLTLTDAEKKALICYFLHQDESILAVLEERLKSKPEALDQLEFVRLQLNSINGVLPYTLMLVQNKDYGPTKVAEANELVKKLPIPYLATGIPIEGNKFTFEVTMNLAMQMLMIKPLSEQFLSELISRYIQQAEEEVEILKIDHLDKTQAAIAFQQKFEKYLSKRLSELLVLREEDNEAYYKFLGTLINNRVFKQAILQETIIPMIPEDPLVYSCNSHDLYDMLNSQAMSGTPVNVEAFHPKLKFDESQTLGTDGITIDLLVNRKDTKVLVCDEPNNVEAVLSRAMGECKHFLYLRALIDAGGLFKDDLSNLVIAQKIGAFFKKHPNRTSKKIKCVIFVDADTNELLAWDIENQKVISLDNKSDEKEISKRLNCNPDERFTFYDEARITGTDIKQAPNAHALVTFSEETVLSKVLQGNNRLREFADNQSSTLVEPAYLVKRVPPQIDAVVHFLKDNEDKALKSHIHFTGCMELFESILKNDLLADKVDKAPDSEERKRLFDFFKSRFSEHHKQNYHELYAGIDKQMEAGKYFQDMAEKYYGLWMDLLKDAHIQPTPKDEEKIRERLTKNAEHAAKICNEFIFSKNGYNPSLKMQVKSEIQLKTQNEMHVKLQTTAKTLPKPYDVMINTINPFQLETKLEQIKVENYANSLVSANAVIPLNNAFDECIFVSQQAASTLLTREQEPYYKEYHNNHTKPIFSVMMVAHRDNPDALQSVILTENESNFYADHNDPEQLKKDYPNHYVWFVSPSDTFKYEDSVFGEMPPTQPKTYKRILEQLRFINGDVKDLARGIKDVEWLKDNIIEKLKFLVQKILTVPSLSEKAKHFQLLVMALKSLEMGNLGLESTSSGEEKREPAEKTQEFLVPIKPVVIEKPIITLVRSLDSSQGSNSKLESKSSQEEERELAEEKQEVSLLFEGSVIQKQKPLLDLEGQKTSSPEDSETSCCCNFLLNCLAFLSKALLFLLIVGGSVGLGIGTAGLLGAAVPVLLMSHTVTAAVAGASLAAGLSGSVGAYCCFFSSNQDQVGASSQDKKLKK